MTFFLIAQKLNIKIAFNFLEELKSLFFKTFSNERIYDAQAFQLNSFDKKMKNLMEKYENFTERSYKKLKEINENDIIKENALLMSDNNAKGNILCEKANKMRDYSENFLENIEEMNAKKKNKNKFLKLLPYIALGVILIILVIFVLVKLIKDKKNKDDE